MSPLPIREFERSISTLIAGQARRTRDRCSAVFLLHNLQPKYNNKRRFEQAKTHASNAIAYTTSMALPLPPGLTPNEVGFLCEMEQVTVIPRQRLEALELLGVST